MSTYEDIIADRQRLKQVKTCLNAVMPTLDGLVTVEEKYQNKIEKKHVPSGFETKVIECENVSMVLKDGVKFAFVGEGVVVTDVSEESKQGLVVKPGYLITDVGDVKLVSIDSLLETLEELKNKGDKFSLTVKIAKPKTLAAYLKAEELEMKEPSDLDHSAFEAWVQKTRSPEQIRDKGLKKWTAKREEKIGELELSLGAINDSPLKQDVQDLIKLFRDDFDRVKLGNFNFDVKKVSTSIFRLETDLLKKAKEAKAEAECKGKN